jgi:gliding motility-associated-like protein
LVIPAGVLSDTIGISAIFDGLIEGNETVFFNVIVPNPCDGTFDTTSISLTIIDYLPLTIKALDSVNVCADFGEWTSMWCQVGDGVPPYTYYWQPSNFPNNDTVNVNPTILQPNLNIFTVNALDQCGKTISSPDVRVYNQCPLVVPNVITTNDDQTNDILIIRNWEDYDKVSLTVFNRWGNVVYSNEDYKNDWGGKDLSGNNNDGEILGCAIVDMEIDSYTEMKIPHRKKSLFKLLPHEENGFLGNRWKDHATRWNQLRFHNEVFLNPKLIK